MKRASRKLGKHPPCLDCGELLSDCRILRCRSCQNVFSRVHKEWQPSNWDDGYVNNRGRFMVYSPDSQRAYSNGYIMRSIAVWEYYIGVVGEGYDIHHINGYVLDDRLENLERILHNKHSVLHNLDPLAWVDKKCKSCGIEFKIERWRLKDLSRGQYCKPKCYYDSKRRKR